MSDNPLPEDVSLWPRDPFELLGVRFDADSNDIKRAYTRLIRRFKPEHFPEQFRRLREAYEAITNLAAFSISDWPSFQQAAQASTAHPPADRAGHSAEAPAKADASHDVFHALWHQAKEGQIDTVLHQLRSHPWQPDQLARAKLMEYWLTKLAHPDPSDARAGKLLAENLHHFRSVPKVLSIARHELYLHPELAEVIDLEKCLDGFLVIPNLHELIQLRWDAALRAWNFGLIRNDYQFLARRFFEHRAAREMIAILAVDRLIWASHPDDKAETQRIIADIESISGLRHERWADFDRLDYLLLLQTDLESASTHDEEWRSVLQMVRWMWNRSEPDYLNKAMDWLVEAAERGTKALAFFDCLLQTEALAAFCVAEFERAIRYAAHSDDDERTEKLFTLVSQWQSEPPNPLEVALIEDFLGSYNNEFYVRFRVRTLEFCLRENIALQQVIRYIRESDTSIAAFFRIEISDKLASDRSLHTLLDLLQKMAMVGCVTENN